MESPATNNYQHNRMYTSCLLEQLFWDVPLPSWLTSYLKAISHSNPDDGDNSLVKDR